MPGEVGGGHHQIDRVAGRNQRSARLALRHGGEGIGQQPRKTRPAERRLEPARADQARHFGTHFGPGVGGETGLVKAAAGQAQGQPDHRPGPDLGQPAPRPRLWRDQDIAVGRFQPQPRQGIEALPADQRLGQKHGVYTARAGARQDIRDQPQRQIACPPDRVKQAVIDARHAVWRRITGMPRPAGAGGMPDVLGHAMHRDRQADPAITDQRDAQFFLPHWRSMASGGRADQCDWKIRAANWVAIGCSRCKYRRQPGQMGWKKSRIY